MAKRNRTSLVRYGVLVAALVLVGYNSIYIRKLSDVRSAAAAGTFDAAGYARHFLHATLPGHVGSAIELSLLSSSLAADTAKAWSWSHAVNAGNARFFMVHGVGRVTKIDSEDVYVEVAKVSQRVSLATRYIIGTAARDGSGLISVDEFTTTMEMNTVSEELNKLIRKEVLPPFVESVKVGNGVEFTGCVEFMRNKAIPDTIEITPLILKIQ